MDWVAITYLAKTIEIIGSGWKYKKINGIITLKKNLIVVEKMGREI